MPASAPAPSTWPIVIPRGSGPSRRRTASVVASEMPTVLPTTRPTTTPIVTGERTALEIASPPSGTPALASAKIGTTT